MSANYEVKGSTAVITMNNPPVNGLGLATRSGIFDGLKKAMADKSVKSVVITGGGKAFSGGADIKEFNSPKSFAEPSLHTVIAAIEDADKPVIAAVHSVAMGGGLELALACHYRVASPGAQIALPEVKLGILPGAGGTQRFPRVVGVETALNMIVSGTPALSEKLAGTKLFDQMIEGDLMTGAIAFAGKVADARPLPKVRDIKIDYPNHEAFFQFARNTVGAMAKNFPAPKKCVDCVAASVSMKFEDGLKYEREAFVALVQTTESKALRHFFFGERAASKISDIAEDTPKRSIKSAAIIGAGTMGGGIAMNFANAGIPVTLIEVKQDALDRGLSVIRKNYERTASRGGITAADVEKRMGLISGSLDMNALAPVDMVIEAVFERMDIKKDIFTRLDAICKPGAILATNTSALNIDEIASVTRRPEAVIGLHFFSPANVMKLLEVVRADHTSKPVIATSMKLAKKIGKIAALVGVCPGFVGNRILGQRQREAQKLMFEGAMPWDIDRVLYDFGFPMGPFAMSDLAGLDIGWVKENSKGETIRDVLCELDRRGQKTGAGYYDYDENRVAHPSPVTEQIIKDFVAKSGVNPRTITDEEILERCLYPMVNEGAKILEEGKAIRASDIDVIWQNGYGWPVYRGGPMFWGDQVGLAKILAKMKEFQAQMGDVYKPAALLETMVAEGKSFTR